MGRIDVHAHFLPPKYREECERAGYARADGMPSLPAWTLKSQLELMNEANITKSILSISSPSTSLTAVPQEAAELTSYCNDFAADLKSKHPDKFGFWASLPLPNIDSTLKEIDRAEKIGADGYCLMTNWNGHYLGDEKFESVFQELNRRKAIVFIHPTTPCIACTEGHDTDVSSMEAAPLARKYPSPMFEFMFDTARAFTNLLLSGTFTRHPDIQYVIPHLGGALPPILTRVASFSSIIPGMTKLTQEDVIEVLQKQIYFDLAGFAFPGQFIGLVKGVGVDTTRLLYGSDYPFTPAAAVKALAEKLDSSVLKDFDTSVLEAMCCINATKMLGGKGRNKTVPKV